MNLLEILISTLIGMMISILFLNLLSQANKESYLNGKRLKAYQEITAVDSHLKSAIRELDTFRYAPRPIIHKAPFSSLKDTITPDNTSDAISFLTLNNTALINVRYTDQGLVTCTPDIQKLSKKYGIASTGDSLFEITWTHQKENNCYNLNITALSSSLFFNIPKTPDDTLRIRVIVPIEKNITYFVSPKKTLRLAQFIGGTIIENQPLTTVSSDITFKDTTEENEIYTLTTLYQLHDSSRLLLKKLRTVLSRKDLHSYLYLKERV